MEFDVTIIEKNPAAPAATQTQGSKK